MEAGRGVAVSLRVVDGSSTAYPSHWEADVVLRDGGTAHLRPILPSDADRLRRFHGRLSEETIYFRFFAVVRELSDRDVQRFTTVDHNARVALVATVGAEIVGVVRYEQVDAASAEVAFTIEDDYQGRGLGSVLLEHVAAAARERGISRFVAEVLPANRKMLRVFEEAGYVVSSALDDGVVRLSFDLEPTENSQAVTYAREHRSEALSVERLLRPRAVAVVGASRREEAVGSWLLRAVRDGGFRGKLFAVHPEADEIEAVRCYPSVRDIPGAVDLVLVAVPAPTVERIVEDCAAKSVRGLVVVSEGFAESGTEEGRDRQRRLVSLARGSGMRVVGPGSFGLINTDPTVSLNASLLPEIPRRGGLGFFTQSGSLGIALLDNAARRGLGLTTFVSAGNRVDVSGNDLMQYWEEDDRTSAVLMYLESLGNPRKFSRLARRLSRRKPVVVATTGAFSGAPPEGHLVRRTRAPAAALDALLRQAGVVRVDSVSQLFDVGELLAHQPLPRGPKVAVLGNSQSLIRLALAACADTPLARSGAPVYLDPDASGAEFEEAIDGVFTASEVDSVVALFVPPFRTRDEDVAQVLLASARSSGKTVVAVLLGMRAPTEDAQSSGQTTEPAPRGTQPDAAAELPTYPTPEDAVRALAAVTTYAQWRAEPAGKTVEPTGLDVRGARAVVARALQAAAEVELGPEVLAELLGCYGVAVLPMISAASRETALSAAAELGYPVALKTLAPHLRHRSDLGGVRLHIDDPDEMIGAYDAMAVRLGPGSQRHFAVQQMVPAGVACVVRTREDPLLGPVVSFGLGGVATELLGDVAYAIPPLTDVELSALVRSVRAAPLLFGHRGSEPGDVAALEDVLGRLARLADDVPEVAELELNPVVVASSGVNVLSAYGRLARRPTPRDRRARALLGG